jgi:hypothetical protein
MLQGLQISGALTNGATMNAAGTFGRFGSRAGAGGAGAAGADAAGAGTGGLALVCACGFADIAAGAAAAPTGAARTTLVDINPAAATVQRRRSPTRTGRIIWSLRKELDEPQPIIFYPRAG